MYRPLQPSDIEPGAIFRHDKIGWETIARVDHDHITLPVMGKFTFLALFRDEKWEMKNLHSEWRVCKRLDYGTWERSQKSA